MKKSIKDAAKKGQMDVCKILAKELVQSRKAVSKMYTSKAQMNSVIMSMQQQQGKRERREEGGREREGGREGVGRVQTCGVICSSVRSMYDLVVMQFWW